MVSLNRSGEIVNTQVKRSSGDPDFDQECIQAVLKSSPFSEIRGLNDEEFEEAKDIEFRFVIERELY